MTNPSAAPQEPFFPTIQRNYLTEAELNKELEVINLPVYGQMSKRGKHRKEIVEESFEFKVIVPKNYNRGQVKLQVNREIKRKGGIRARIIEIDENGKIEPLEIKMKVRDFMSKEGMMANERLKKHYQKTIEERRRQMQEQINSGMMPFDNTEYGADGLPKFSEKLYTT